MYSLMRWMLPVGVVVAMCLAQPSATQAQSVTPAEASLPGAVCLSDAQREVNAKLKALSRATTKDDHVWVFDPEYFVGTWDLEWGGPDTPLTTEVSGTLTVTHVEGCSYEGTLQAKTLDEPYSAKIQILMDPARSWLTWIENDSRGFTVIHSGFVGSDLGGYFTHFWEHSPAFMYKGEKIRLYGSTFLSSPGAFLLRSQISIDGGRYLYMGGLWFNKRITSPTSAAEGNP